MLIAIAWVSLVFYKCLSQKRWMRLFVVFGVLNISFSPIYHWNFIGMVLILTGISMSIDYVFFDHVMKASLSAKQQVIKEFNFKGNDMPMWMFILIQIMFLLLVGQGTW